MSDITDFQEQPDSAEGARHRGVHIIDPIRFLQFMNDGFFSSNHYPSAGIVSSHIDPAICTNVALFSDALTKDISGYTNFLSRRTENSLRVFNTPRDEKCYSISLAESAQFTAPDLSGVRTMVRLTIAGRFELSSREDAKVTDKAFPDLKGGMAEVGVPKILAQHIASVVEEYGLRLANSVSEQDPRTVMRLALHTNFGRAADELADNILALRPGQTSLVAVYKSGATWNKRLFGDHTIVAMLTTKEVRQTLSTAFPNMYLQMAIVPSNG